MYEKILNKYAIKQVAYVVEDLEKGALEHSALFGSGPFVYMPTYTPATATLKGEEITLNLEEAYGGYGDTQIELIEVPKTGDVGIFGKPGFHHFAIWVDDLDQAIAEFAEAGFDEVLTMVSDSGMVVKFVDCTEKWGHYVELYAPQTFLADLNKGLTAAWDGTEPYRSMMDVMAQMKKQG